MKSYVLIRCLKCNRTFKSNKETKRPKCSMCGSYHVMNASDVPVGADVEHRLGVIELAINKMTEFMSGYDKERTQIIHAFNGSERGVWARIDYIENEVSQLNFKLKEQKESHTRGVR